MMEPRKNVVVNVEDFSAITILKPFSQEYLNYFFVIFEDAYGEMNGKLVEKNQLQKRFGLSDAEIQEVEKSL